MSQTKAQLLDNIKDNVQLDARNSLRFADTDSSHYVAFKAPATVSSNVTWTLPAADGSANYVLATDGSGNLSWIADPAGQWVTSGSNIYFTGGNVGIGDSSPSNPLSVTGVSAFNGDVTFAGASYNATWDKSADSLIFNDNAKAYWGTDSDLRIQHTGTHGYIDNETGNLYIRNDGTNDDSNIYIQAKNGEESIICHDDGEVQLYFDGNEKLNTVTDGINITGSLQFADDTNTYLQRSAADTLQIVTGGTAALTVDASQEVGIGVTAPAFKLDIRATTSEDVLRLSNSSESSHGSHDTKIVAGGTYYQNPTLVGSVVKFKTYNGSAEGERIRIDKDGRLLIGHTATVDTSTYNSNLQVMGTDAHGSSAILGRFSNDASASSLHFSKSRNGTKGSHTVVNDNDGIGNIFWWASDGSDYEEVARIGAEIDGTPGSGDTPGALTFHTTADGASTSTQRMIIKNGGSVGIGTTGPENRLHVVSTNYQTARFESSAADANGAYVEIYANSSSPADNDISGILSFKAKNSAAEEITYAQIRTYLDDVTDGTEDGSLTFHTRDEGSFAQRMRLTSSGKLGIGTTAPENLLHINTSGASGNGITMKSTDSYYPRIVSDANRDSGDNFLLHIDGRWNGTSVAQIVLETGGDTTNKDDGRITFRTAAAGTTVERMRIDNTGKVGINTGEGSAPADWLHINTTDNNNTGIKLKTTGNSYSTIIGDANRDAVDNYLLRVVGSWNTTEVAQITLESGNDTTNKDDGQINFWTQESGGGGLVERFCIEPDGDVRVKTGNIEISTSGKGIDFSATSGTGTSELLDDYEEGTFVSHLLATDLTLTSNTYTCYYTKIGRVVTINGYAQGTTPADISAYVANSSHSLSVGNLPFNIINSVGARGAAIVGVNAGFTISNDHYLSTHGTANSNSFSIWQEPNANGTRIGPVLIASTGMALHFQFTYQTT